MAKNKEPQKFKLQEFIKHNNFGFFIAVCAVIFQALHTQYNLKRLSSLSNVFGADLSEYHAMGLAAIISMAILYFTLRGRANQAIGWACFEAYMNICYYAIYISSTPADDNYLYWIAIPAALALPTILGMFSKELLFDGEGDISNDSIEKLKEFFSLKIADIYKEISKITTMNEVEKDSLKQQVNDIDASVNKFLKQEITLENIETGTTVRVKMK